MMILPQSRLTSDLSSTLVQLLASYSGDGGHCVNSDIQTLLPGYVLNDFQTDFWLRFCTAFPNLLVEATVDSFYLRFDVRSPEQTDSESGIAVLVSKWGDEEIIVAFGGHVNTRYFSYHP